MNDLWEHIDLCSGIGGFSLGFQYAKLSEPILFCELDEFCQKILKKHWPDVPICNDVKELADDTTKFIPRKNGRKRILTSGFPCQPWSVAGAKRGKEDPRHIWPWIIEIVAQERPELCVFENVPNLATLGGLDEVIVDLANENYATTTLNLSAFSAAGAPHKRERLWIIARNMGNANDNGSSTTEIRRSNEEDAEGSQEGEIKTEQFEGTSGRENYDDVADTKSLHSNVSRKYSKQSKRQIQKFREGSRQVNVADTINEGSQRWLSGGKIEGWQGELGHSGCSSTTHRQPEERKQATQRRLGRNILDGLSAWMDEPVDIPRVATGQKNRTHRLKALGNAIVPQIAQRIGIAIRESF